MLFFGPPSFQMTVGRVFFLIPKMLEFPKKNNEPFISKWSTHTYSCDREIDLVKPTLSTPESCSQRVPSTRVNRIWMRWMTENLELMSMSVSHCVCVCVIRLWEEYTDDAQKMDAVSYSISYCFNCHLSIHLSLSLFSYLIISLVFSQ